MRSPRRSCLNAGVVIAGCRDDIIGFAFDRAVNSYILSRDVDIENE
jgi:hypothetical protein